MNRTLHVFAAAITLTFVAAATAQKIGDEAPPLEIKDFVNGKQGESLAGFRNKVVVLTFFRTSDPDADDIAKNLSALHKSFYPRVIVIGIIPEAKDKVEAFAKSKQIEFRLWNYTSSQEGQEPKLEKWNVSPPRAFIIDPSGKIADQRHPGDNLEERVRSQLERTPVAGSDKAALMSQLAAAQQLSASKSLGKAYTIAKRVLSLLDENSAEAAAVKELIKQLNEAGQKAFEELKEKAKEKKFDEACPRLAEFSVRFAGEDWVKDVDSEVGRLQSDRESKARMKKAMDNARGELRNEQAAELEATKQYLEAKAIYKDVVEKYPDTDAFKAAQQAIDRISNDPTIRRTMEALVADEEANRLLDLADRYAKVEMNPEARELYQKVISAHPKSVAATRAKERLAKLPADEPADAADATKKDAEAGTGEKKPGGDKEKDKGG